MFERVTEVLATKGHARLLAWLLLSGQRRSNSKPIRDGWRAIAEATHAARGKAHLHRDGKEASFEDTRFTIVLSALALFGQAIAGDATFGAAGFAGDAKAQKRFRKWLAEMLGSHLGA